MIRRFVVLVFLAASTLVAACTDNPLSPAEQQALVQARSRWAELGGDNYTVEARVSCFCPPHLLYWTRLTVRGGVVTAAEPVETLPEGWETSVDGWYTVLELFDIAAHPATSVVKDVKVQFDNTLGYPLKVETICKDNIADCGSVRELRNLHVTR